MGKIFINYRRQDSQDMAGRLYDRLEARFGADAVFKDVDSLPLGEKFPEKIQQTIAQCDVVLTLMGEHWLEARDAEGRRRLDDAGDYVRLEIEEALRLGVQPLPVLLHAAKMPPKEELPASCAELVNVNAARLRADPDFKHDVGKLISTVESLIAQRTGERSARESAFDARARAREEALRKELAERALLDHLGEQFDDVKTQTARMPRTQGQRMRHRAQESTLGFLKWFLFILVIIAARFAISMIFR